MNYYNSKLSYNLFKKKKSMKKIVLITTFIALSMLSANAQTDKGFKINGDLKNYTNDYVYIGWWYDGKLNKDSAKVTDGKFSFKGSVVHPIRIGMSQKRAGDFLNLFLENSDIQIVGDMKSLNNVKITGTATEDEYDAFQNITKKARTDYMEVLYKRDEYKKRKDTTGFYSFDDELTNVKNKYIQSQVAYIKNHPKSYVSLWLLPRINQMGISYESLKDVYASIDDVLKKTPIGVSVAKGLAKRSVTAIGAKAADFTVASLDGKNVSLADYKGRYVLLDFWSSNCVPCRRENPNIIKNYNKFKSEKFEIIGVSVDTDREAWKKAIEKDKLPWIQLSDLKGWKSEVAVKYNVNALPANFLIDPDGNIIAKNLKGKELQSYLSKLFSK
ncbi:MAG: AhpC/TSA family protein [Chitinophagaceae bacterium]|nr:MAG: AhpC/TSA family protein [Chitinophagaceae bacterium]